MRESPSGKAGDFGAVNVTTHYSVDTLACSFMSDGFFEVADILHGIFDFVLKESRQRPVFSFQAGKRLLRA